MTSCFFEFYDTVVSEQGFFMEGGDNHIYNRTQFSMLQSFNHHWPSSGLRYEINSLINGYKLTNIYTPFEKIISISFSLKKKKRIITICFLHQDIVLIPHGAVATTTRFIALTVRVLQAGLHC